MPMKSTIITLIALFVLSFNPNFSYISFASESQKRLNVSSLKFKDFNNNERTVAEYTGKPIVLHFWATWCPPCIKELPHLAEYQLEKKNEVNVIPIIILDPKSDKYLANFKKKLNIESLPFYKGLTNIDYIKELNVSASSLPFSVFIDTNGNVVDTINGVVDWKTL